MGMISERGPERPHGGTLALDVLVRLRDDILSCRLAPGAKLPFQALKDRYQVNFGPLREALMQLAAEGLVDMTAQRGCRVAPISAADLIDTTNTRVFVEREMLRQAMRDGDVEWEAQLLAAFRRLEAVESALDRSADPPPRWAVGHRDCHQAVAAAGGSPLLQAISAKLFDRARRYRTLSLRRPAHVRAKAAEHRALMQAALDRDVVRALSLLEEHLQETAVLAIEALRHP